MIALAALAGRRPERVDDAYALRLMFSAPDPDEPRESIEIRIETPFVVRGPDGREHRCEPESALSLPVDLRTLVVREASIIAPVTLRVAFDDGTELVVEPNSDYEAWQVAGPGNARVVCPPGGGEPVIWS